jgi:hypothetical protein
MKIINKPHTIVTLEDAMKLLTKFIEKKTGKKVVNIDLPPAAVGLSFRVEFEEETCDLEDPKGV